MTSLHYSEKDEIPHKMSLTVGFLSLSRYNYPDALKKYHVYILSTLLTLKIHLDSTKGNLKIDKQLSELPITQNIHTCWHTCKSRDISSISNQYPICDGDEKETRYRDHWINIGCSGATDERKFKEWF